jgi:hypothetical protein
MSDDGRDQDQLTVVDLLLDEGTPQAQAAVRARIAEDPALAIEMAETVALFEEFRQLEVEPSARLGCRLSDVVRRAERRTLQPTPVHWVTKVTWVAAAAVVAFALLWQFDPLHRREHPQAQQRARIDAVPGAVQPAPGESEPAGQVAREATEVAWEEALETMRSRLAMETSRRLGQALQTALLPPADPMQRWLDPRNTLASLRAEHESRARPEVRRALLRHQGGLAAVDARVQELTDRIVAELLDLKEDPAGAQLPSVALAVRALIAAGAVDERRTEALAFGSRWLATQLPGCAGERLVSALAPLVEVAAVSGDYGDLVAQHGGRLVDEVLRTDEDTWGRRLPELLTGTVPAATLGDAVRVLGLLPGVGVAPARCHIVRQLLLGRLRERRDAGDDGPELLAAMLYGGADLLAAGEREEVERQLRRWTPLRLAPDFVTVHQLAWGFEPARVGFTRLQRELRRLAVLSDPGRLGTRAAFCLCLATNYAAWPSGAQFGLYGE